MYECACDKGAACGMIAEGEQVEYKTRCRAEAEVKQFALMIAQ